MHYLFTLIIIKTHLFSIECNTLPLNLDEVIKTEDLYQITLFVPDSFTNMTELNNFLHREIPIVTYSFNEDRQALSYSFENVLKGVGALQESLVIFSTNNLTEIREFLYFLELELTVRKSPNCLILYLSNASTTFDESSSINDILKFAWKLKFLDFTIISYSSSLIYYNNPFINVIHKKKLRNGRDIEIFPDKLKNAYGYPIYIPMSSHSSKVTHVKDPYRKLKIHINPNLTIDFAARILNLSIVIRNTDHENPAPKNYLNKWRLDLHSEIIADVNYYERFVIPSDFSPENNVFAFVPIIFTTRTYNFLKMFINVIVVFGIFSIILFAFGQYGASIGHIGVFDVVLLFFGQSITTEPYKTVHKIVLLTIVVASVKVTNDFLLDVLLIQFDNEEMAFESYEDLYNSQLQTYTNFNVLKTNNVSEDLYLLKILNRTLIIDDYHLENCFDDLKNWKNVSCICMPFDINYIIGHSKVSPDSSPTIKVAQPPIYVKPLAFYWFAEASPYAMKFFKIMRKIKEGNLFYWPALMEKKPNVLTIEQKSLVLFDDSVNTEQLLVVLCFGYFISTLAFILDCVLCRFRKMIEFEKRV